MIFLRRLRCFRSSFLRRLIIKREGKKTSFHLLFFRTSYLHPCHLLHWQLRLGLFFFWLAKCTISEVEKSYIAWPVKCPLKTKWGSLIPRPLKMNEGLSTSERQAEGENRLGKWKFLPILPLNLTIVIVELATMLQTYQLYIIC